MTFAACGVIIFVDKILVRHIMATFLATLTPMLTLFICIAAGFGAAKAKLLPENSGVTMARLETWIFVPALNITTMMRYCTVDSLSTHGTNVILATISVGAAMIIAIPLARIFVREGGAERGIYCYALAFANSGYMGDPIVLALFGEEVLAYYKIFCIPLTFAIYTWGASILTPDGNAKGNPLKKLINPPTISALLGIFLGLIGAVNYIPAFIINALDTLKACMGPVAMLLAGVTVAKYDFFEMLKNKKVYIVTALRLTVLPAVLVALAFGIKSLANLIFGFSIGNDVLFLCFFSTGAALGLNTIIFPEAYGGNPKTGASMAMISNTLCVISIPIMYAIMTAIFGTPYGA